MTFVQVVVEVIRCPQMAARKYGISMAEGQHLLIETRHELVPAEQSEVAEATASREAADAGVLRGYPPAKTSTHWAICVDCGENPAARWEASCPWCLEKKLQQK